MKPGQLTWPQRGALWLRLAIRLALALAAVGGWFVAGRR